MDKLIGSEDVDGGKAEKEAGIDVGCGFTGCGCGAEEVEKSTEEKGKGNSNENFIEDDQAAEEGVITPEGDGDGFYQGWLLGFIGDLF